jgi:hypothetical protein
MTEDPARSSEKHASAPQVFEVRGLSVILDADLARLFGVETKRLNQQVRRNGQVRRLCLPADHRGVRGFEVANCDLKVRPRRSLAIVPYVFTEHGVVMAATVLQSEQAIAASRFIIKVFVEARRKSLVSDGANLPSLIDARGLLPLESEARTGLMSKLNGALGPGARRHRRSGDPDHGPRRGPRHRRRGLRSIKEYLKRAGVQNEKTLAEVRKLLAEADALEAETAQKRTENQHRQLALLAKQLRLVLVAQQYLETGGVEGLLATLKDLERP